MKLSLECTVEVILKTAGHQLASFAKEEAEQFTKNEGGACSAWKITKSRGPTTMCTWTLKTVHIPQVTNQGGRRTTCTNGDSTLSSPVRTTRTLRGAVPSGVDTADHPETGKSGYVPTNTYPFTKGKRQVQLDPQNLQQNYGALSEDKRATPLVHTKKIQNRRKGWTE